MFTVHRYQPAADDVDAHVSGSGKEADSQPQQQDVAAETITVLSRRKAERLKRRQESAAAASQPDDAADAAEERSRRLQLKRQKREGRRQRDTEQKEATETEDGDAAQRFSAMDLRALRSVKNSTRPQRQTSRPAAAPSLPSAVRKGQQKKDPLVRAAERAARKRAREIKERRDNGEDLPAEEEERMMQEAAEAAVAAASQQAADEEKDGALAGTRKKARTEQQQHSGSSAADPSSSSPAAPTAAEEQQVREQRRLAARPQWMSAAHHVDPKASCPASALSLHPHLVQRLQHHGITELFPVQAAAIPVILSQPDRDVCVSSPTGSGKTLIYILPILHVLSSRRVLRLRCLVLVPSRDLCRQVGREMEEYAGGLGLKVGVSVGGGSFQREQDTLVRRRQPGWSEMLDYSTALHALGSRRGRQGDTAADEAEWESAVDVLVTTPGRLMDHLDSTPGFSLRHLRFLVVDEVDRLVTQRYSDWTRRVWEEMRRPPPPATALAPLSLLSEGAECQKLLFSATLSGNPAQLASLRLHRPVLFMDSQSRQKRFSVPAGLSASFFLCDANEKPLLLLHTLSTLQLSSKEEGRKETGKAEGKQRRATGDQVLVFTSSLDSCHRVARLLSLWGGCSSAEYSSALTQHQRDRLLSAFRGRRLSVLVCSDVMSRGLDISGVSVVVNYDPPVYLQTYLHRIGRTARAGAAGRAVTLLKRSEYGFFVAMAKRAANSFMSRQRQDRQAMQQMRPRYSRAISRLREVIALERRGRLSKTERLQPVGDEDEEKASTQAADEEAEEDEQQVAVAQEEGVDEAEWSL